MGSSCCKPVNNDVPEDLETCCNIRGRRCICLPYDNALMITAQVLPIIATFISWIWWVTMILNVGGLVMLQIPWCCRQSKGGLYSTAAVAIFNSLTQFGVGIYILVKWRVEAWCDPFTFWFSPNQYDYCAEKVWGSIAFLCGILWVASAVCVIRFVGSGTHAKWEEKYVAEAGAPVARGVEVELGGPPAAAATNEEDSPAIATASVLEPQHGKEDIPMEATKQQAYKPPSVVPKKRTSSSSKFEKFQQMNL